jgi:ParB family chromosome partitioning protein
MNDETIPLSFSFKSILVSDLQPDPAQPRKKRNEQADKELADSMRLHGMLQTILVREKDGRFIIVNGERRWGAACTLEWEKVDCLVTTADSTQSLTLQLIENVQREDLSPDDLAAHLSALMSQHQAEDRKATLRILAPLIGKSLGWVSEKLALANLPSEVQALKDNKTVRNSRVLIGLSKLNDKNPDAAASLIREINEGKSVSVALVNEVRGFQKKKSRAPGKEEAVISDLPEGDFHPAPIHSSNSNDDIPAPSLDAENIQHAGAATELDKPVKRERKKKVVDLAKLIGVSDELPPEDLLEAFAEAYAKLIEERNAIAT